MWAGCSSATLPRAAWCGTATAAPPTAATCTSRCVAWAVPQPATQSPPCGAIASLPGTMAGHVSWSLHRRMRNCCWAPPSLFSPLATSTHVVMPCLLPWPPWQMGCPFYVSSAVWTAAAVPLSQSKVNLLAMAEMEAAMAASEHTQSASSTASYAQQQQQQPEHRAQHGHHSQQQPQAPPQQQPPQHNPPPLDAFRTPQQGQPHGVGIGPGSASSGQHAGAAHGNGNGKANGAQAANGTAGGSAVPAPPEQAMLVR